MASGKTQREWIKTLPERVAIAFEEEEKGKGFCNSSNNRKFRSLEGFICSSLVYRWTKKGSDYWYSISHGTDPETGIIFNAYPTKYE